MKKYIVVAGAAAVAVIGMAVVVNARKGPSTPTRLTIGASSSTGNPGVVISFSGILSDQYGVGINGEAVSIFVDGISVGSDTTGRVGPAGYYLVENTFPSVGTYSVYAQSGSVKSPTVTVVISQTSTETFVLAAVTASGTCDITFTGTQAEACSTAQALVGQYEDSVLGGCFHEIVSSVKVYLGADLVCQF